MGNQLVNTFDGGGDGLVGILQSPEFTVNKRYLKFLVGGGNQEDKTSVNLLIDEEIVVTAVGNQSETLREITWDVERYAGKKLS